MVLVFLIVEMSLTLLSEVAWMTDHDKNRLVSRCGGNKRAIQDEDRPGDRQALTI